MLTIASHHHYYVRYYKMIYRCKCIARMYQILYILMIIIIINELYIYHLTLLYTAPHCSTQLHTAPHLSTPLHTAPDCSTLLHTAPHHSASLHTAPHCSTLLHTALHSSTLLHIAPHRSTLLNTVPEVNYHSQSRRSIKVNLINDIIVLNDLNTSETN